MTHPSDYICRVCKKPRHAGDGMHKTCNKEMRRRYLGKSVKEMFPNEPGWRGKRIRRKEVSIQEPGAFEIQLTEFDPKDLNRMSVE